jgi:hypothetical protein
MLIKLTMIRNLNQTSAYDNNLDLFIQYFQNPIIQNRSKSQLERIAKAYSVYNKS